MLTKTQKQNLVKDLTKKLAKIKSAVFADYSGLNVAKMTELRRRLKEQGIDIKVAKKTLIDLAAKEAGFGDIETKKMAGQVALLMGYEDEIAPAKVLYDFAKTEEKIKILGGVLENKFIDSSAVLTLAKLPSKQELLATVVGSIAAPLSGLVKVLQGSLRNLVYVLAQIKK